MEDNELERLRARLTAVERILRVDAIQATGDAVDRWWHVAQDPNATATEIEQAGKEAAKEVLATKNREAHQFQQAGISLRDKV